MFRPESVGPPNSGADCQSSREARHWPMSCCDRASQQYSRSASRGQSLVHLLNSIWCGFSAGSTGSVAVFAPPLCDTNLPTNISPGFGRLVTIP
jgi:hypothetical protein